MEKDRESLEDGSLDTMLPTSFGRTASSIGAKPTKVIERVAEVKVQLPLGQRVQLRSHKKTVSALDVDRSGSRMAVGSHDCTISFWDFAGMDPSRLEPFRTVLPAEGCPVKVLRFSHSGDTLLAAAGGALRLLDRHGALLQEYNKGDAYIRDLRNTQGHASAVLAADWHPTRRDRFLTAGQDGTLRIWSAESDLSKYRNCLNTLVVKKPGGVGGRPTAATQALYFPDGRSVACAVGGSLRIYPSEAPWSRPLAELDDAHTADITSIALDGAGRLLATRSLDDSLKLWDLRKLDTALAAVTGLECVHEETQCIFSPDGQLVLTGTSTRKGSGLPGSLHLFDTVTLERILEPVPLSDSSLVTLLWHPVINQILVGSTDGTVSMLYDETVSQRGILTTLARTPTTYGGDAVIAYSTGHIQTPNALPLFRTPEGKSMKRIRIKARQDPKASHRPELPVEGPGRGGRLGSSLTQTIMRGIIKDTRRDEDPREALLKYAEIAERDPKFVTPAYKDTQPRPILDAEQLVREAEEAERKRKAEEIAAKLTGHKTSKLL